MKTIKTNKLILCMVGLVSAIGTAQTINTGELSVSPSTILSTVGALDNKVTGSLVNDGVLYVYSHYNNDGLVTFSTGATTGMTSMRGVSGYQDISGSMPMEWYDGEFNNGTVQPAFHLSNEVSISGQADFNQGIVNNDTYGGSLVFENTAGHANLSDASHVDGVVRKNGNQSFQFPIGDGNKYRHTAISAPDNTTDAFNGKYFLENSDPLYPHSNRATVINLIDTTEYWTVNKVAGDSNILLTLTWDEDTTPAAIYAMPYEEIHIVRWDAAQNLWIDEGGVVNHAAKEVSMVIDPLQGYGIFTLARVKADLILPCGGSGVVVYNTLSPNDDGINDSFIIDGIEKCTNNTVEIFNRWGVKVYETKGYNTNGNVFKGISDGRATVSQDQRLPTGTYFYIINFLNDTSGSVVKKAGYLYINDK